jgi:hypothetical protein
LTILILTFSNSVFADVDDDYHEKRCKVEYTQLDLISGTETIYKNTSQFADVGEGYCDEGLKKLSKKVYKWVDKKNTNVITKINEFQCKIKNVSPFSGWNFDYSWGKYRDCETYIQKLSAYLVDEYPNQIGAKIFQDSIAD